MAGVHGLVYVPFAGHRLGDTQSYVVAAQAIRDGGYTTRLGAVDITGLRVPAVARGAPERQTYRTPGYPLLVAATGGGGLGRPTDAIIAAQALLVGATTVLLMLLVRRLWSPQLALLAGTLSALDPFPKHYVSRIESEVLAGFLVAVVAYVFARAWQSALRAWWAAAGGAGAALTLTRPLFVIALLLLGVAAALSPGTVRTRAVRVGAAAAAGAVLLVPWLGWTTVATGRPVLSSFGEGVNLLIAAHGEGLRRTSVEVESSPAFRRDFLSVHRFAPSATELRSDVDAHPHYLVRADAEQRRLARKLYLERIRDHPFDVLGEIAYRSYFLWQAHEDWVQPGWLLPFLRTLDWLALALAAAGALVALRAGGPARAFAVFLLLFTLVNGLHHVEARYGMPLRTLYVAFVGLALSTLAARRGLREPLAEHGQEDRG